MDSAVSATGSTTGPQPQRVTFDCESGFEPQSRARSNTWPLPDAYVEDNVVPDEPSSREGADGGIPPQQGPLAHGAGLLPVKKNSSRKNAWGNLSYADLITQAITSSPDQRLTLSQIYEWMVHNVAFFKDKGENNSSAGWKNSIRHNLSLHSRFMRVQNEGTGKSSWWMINHDAKPGKSPRRRAPLVETSKSDKGGRGRRKKTLETLRNEVLQIDAIPSPTSSVSEGVDFYPDSPLQPGSGYQMPHEFRPRSMTAPSGGRLTPNPAIPAEPDWSTTYGSSYSPKQLDTFLAGSLAEAMKLEPYQMYQTSPPGHQQQTGPPPSYFEAHYPKSNNLLAGGSSFGLPPTPQTANQQRCPIHRLQPCACQMNLSPVSGMSPSYQQSEPSPTALGNGQQSLQYMMQTQQHQQQQQMQQQQQQLQSGQPDASPPHTPTSCVVTPSTVMGQVIGALNNPTLDDLNIDSLHGGLHSSVEEVLEHELSLTGTLDFNFQQGVMGTAAIQVSEANVEQNGAISQNSGVGTMAGNAPAGVYVNTNAATPAVPPSWVH